MKKACEATALTERAIRLYLKKKLLSPPQIDGTLDFTPADIERLKEIALLRQLDFTLEQIARMIHEPAAIPALVQLRLEQTDPALDHERDVQVLLQSLPLAEADSLHALAALLRARQPRLPTLAFGRFDELSDETRQQEASIARLDLSRLERRSHRRIIALSLLIALATLVLLCSLFLAHPRINGYVSVGPLTVTAVHSDGTATVLFGNPEAAALLGQDAITVPYRIFGVSLQAGDALERGCQLAIRLTNLDLIRIGVSPLQTMQTASAAVNNAWVVHILQSLFAADPGRNATLWIHEPCNLYPLLWLEP